MEGKEFPSLSREEIVALDRMFNPEVTCWDELNDHLDNRVTDTLWTLYKKVRTWIERNPE